MNTGNIKGKLSFAGIQHQIDLPLVYFKDQGVWIIYSPGIDLSGYGKTKSEAENSFQVALAEFINYTSNKGTTLKVLTDLGWSFEKWNKKTKKLTAPDFHEMLFRDAYLKDIFNTKNFQKVNREVKIPAIA